MIHVPQQTSAGRGRECAPAPWPPIGCNRPAKIVPGQENSTLGRGRAPEDFGRLRKFPGPPAATNKCLARNDKSHTGGGATQETTPTLGPKPAWATRPPTERFATMKRLLLAALALGLLSSSALAGPEPGHTTGNKAEGYSFGDHGRFHGYVSNGPGALIPKCNPHVSPECARLHPCLLKGPTYACLRFGR